jgi:hypothetical protein
VPDDDERDLGDEEPLAPPTFTHSNYNIFGGLAPTVETFGEPYEVPRSDPHRTRLKVIAGVLVFLVFGLPILILVIRIIIALVT